MGKPIVGHAPGVEWIEHTNLQDAARAAVTETKPFGLGVVLGSRQVGVRRPRGVKPYLDLQRRRIWRFLGAPRTVGGEDIKDIAVQAGFKGGALRSLSVEAG